jgi:S-adenosylmethionine synthetase
VDLTIACAVISGHVQDVHQYARVKTHLQELAKYEARHVSKLDVSVVVNEADDPDKEDLYLTVTSTSAESGDDGEVGRDNRASGLLTPYRPMTMEAAAGKNPVTQVGKLYSLLGNRIASTLVTELSTVTAADCVLVSGIGQPVSDPRLVDVGLRIDQGGDISALQADVHDIVTSALNHVSDLRDALLQQMSPAV